MSDFRDPQNTKEWQEAVDAAEAYLGLDSAKAYGLVRGGPVVNVFRCEQIIRKGRDRGIIPINENVERVIRLLGTPEESAI